jgi:hypothetical protein
VLDRKPCPSRTVNTAAYYGDRTKLKDPNVMTEAQWNQLVQAKGLGLPVQDPCPTSGSTGVCEYDPHNFMTLTKAAGTVYGWRVTGLQIPTPSS